MRENLAYLQGTPCPSCGHVRDADQPGPRWHCPNCHNEYPSLLPLPALEPSIAAPADPSLLMLLAANLATIGASFWLEFDLRELMLIFWLQSVMIGASFLVRMLVSRPRELSPWPAGFRWLDGGTFNALFFLLHYGGFHTVYFTFIRPADLPGLFSGVGLCALGFAASQGYSLWREIPRDRAAGVSAATLLWVPYARIVPMHLTIIFGPQIAGGAYALLMFLGLKTLADAVMHVAAERVLRRA